MLIVEGPDGAGKTTLIGRIEADWGLVREPRAVSKDAVALTKVDDYIETELARGFGMRLYDRFALLSSPCYAMLQNRTFSGRMFDPIWLRAQYEKFLKIDPVIIVCLPSLDEVRKNTHVGDDNKVVQNDIETIYINYLNYWASQAGNTSVMRWDYQDPNEVRLGNLVQWAKGRVEYEQHGEERRHQRWKTDLG